MSLANTKTGARREIERGERFAFGENWSRFLEILDDRRVAEAEQSLREMLEVDSLQGLRFVDLGSGSGLFSLAARRLGAEVCSVDFDPASVACTETLKQRYFPDDGRWQVHRGSVLDEAFLEGLGQFDVVYSWGVLHHTGRMWQAMENAAGLCPAGGRLFVAIYNDQGRASRRWLKVKQMYNRLPPGLRWLVLWPAFLRLWGPTTVRDLLSGRPMATWRSYARERGMTPWRDVVDWVGGLPFEVATPEEVFQFLRARGFVLQGLRTCAGGIGCNEFVLVRTPAPQAG